MLDVPKPATYRFVFLTVILFAAMQCSLCYVFLLLLTVFLIVGI